MVKDIYFDLLDESIVSNIREKKAKPNKSIIEDVYKRQSKYILRAIGKPTEAIKVCNSEFILRHILSILLINKKAMPKI